MQVTKISSTGKLALPVTPSTPIQDIPQDILVPFELEGDRDFKVVSLPPPNVLLQTALSFIQNDPKLLEHALDNLKKKIKEGSENQNDIKMLTHLLSQAPEKMEEQIEALSFIHKAQTSDLEVDWVLFEDDGIDHGVPPGYGSNWWAYAKAGGNGLWFLGKISGKALYWFYNIFGIQAGVLVIAGFFSITTPAFALLKLLLSILP